MDCVRGIDYSSGGFTWRIRNRDPNAGDDSFIYDSWLDSYAKGSDEAKATPSRFYRQGEHKLIERCLARSNVLLACNPEAEQHIFGYIVAETGFAPCLHYLYVKNFYRRAGLARSLMNYTLDYERLEYSHRTAVFKKFMNLKSEKITFNPYRFWL